MDKCTRANAFYQLKAGATRPAAGLAAQQQSGVALQLLGALLALQGAFTLLALVLRPYISAVLTSIEVACGCLDVAYLAVTMATYFHTSGTMLAKGKAGADPYLVVRGSGLISGCCCQSVCGGHYLCAAVPGLQVGWPCCQLLTLPAPALSLCLWCSTSTTSA